jgi:hypothetical protein
MPAMTAIFDDHGIRFEYPADWEVDVIEDDARATVAVQSPTGLAFTMVTIDADRPTPAELADEALAAMREEYPDLDAVPALETIDGHKAIGHDVEFISLDVPNACVIRSYRTPRRTILVFAQWSDLDDEEDENEEPETLARALRRSLEETDA